MKMYQILLSLSASSIVPGPSSGKSETQSSFHPWVSVYQYLVVVQEYLNVRELMWSSVIASFICVSVFLLSEGLALLWQPCEDSLCSRCIALYLETDVDDPDVTLLLASQCLEGVTPSLLLCTPDVWKLWGLFSNCIGVLQGSLWRWTFEFHLLLL